MPSGIRYCPFEVSCLLDDLKNASRGQARAPLGRFTVDELTTPPPQVRRDVIWTDSMGIPLKSLTFAVVSIGVLCVVVSLSIIRDGDEVAYPRLVAYAVGLFLFAAHIAAFVAVLRGTRGRYYAVFRRAWAGMLITVGLFALLIAGMGFYVDWFLP